MAPSSRAGQQRLQIQCGEDGASEIIPASGEIVSLDGVQLDKKKLHVFDKCTRYGRR